MASAKQVQAAKRKNIAGRSRMGKWDLIQAIRKAS